MKKVMGITPVAPLLMCGLMFGSGCGKPSQDTSPVLANVGGQKITQKDLEDAIRAVVPDPATADQFLHSDARRDQRNGFLGKLSQQKAVLELARLEGVDKDPKVRLDLEGAIAQVYWDAIIAKRSTPMVPTDADLRKLYDDVVANQKASGNLQPPPPFESVKPTLTQVWQKQQAQASQKRLETELAKELEARVPTTYAEDYQPKRPALN